MSEQNDNLDTLSPPTLQRTEPPLTERLAERQIHYKNTIDEILSEEEKTKYCLIFSNQVFNMFDTYDEALKIMNDSNLLFTMWCPKRPDNLEPSHNLILYPTT